MSRPNQLANSIPWAILFALLSTQLANAQAYRLEQLPIPEGWYVNDFNNQGFVVGHSRFTDGETVVLYDHQGVLGTAGKTWSLDELITLPAEYASVSILDINNLGQFVAYLLPEVGPRESILVDLFDSEGNFNPTWKYLNLPASSGLTYAKRVNDFGQVLGQFVADTSGDTYAFLLDSTDPNATPQVLTDPTTGQPIYINYSETLRLNNLGQVAGNTVVETNFGYGLAPGGFRWTPGPTGPGLLITPLTEAIPSTYMEDMNDDGVVVGTAAYRVIGSGKKGKTSYVDRGILFDQAGYEFLTPPTTNVYCLEINNSSDVLGYIESFDGTRKSQFLVHDSNLLYLDDLVTGTSDDVAFWLAATHFGTQQMSDRDDTTGFSQIFARAEVAVTTGKGRNRTTTSETRFFMLTPEQP